MTMMSMGTTTSTSMRQKSWVVMSEEWSLQPPHHDFGKLKSCIRKFLGVVAINKMYQDDMHVGYTYTH